jgi:hypothetical protein
MHHAADAREDEPGEECGDEGDGEEARPVVDHRTASNHAFLAISQSRGVAFPSQIRLSVSAGSVATRAALAVHVQPCRWPYIEQP